MDLSVIISLPIIAVFGFVGFRDGVIKRIIEVAGVLATLLLTAHFAAVVNPWMMDKTGLTEGTALLVTWAVLFFLGLVLSRVLASLLTKLVNMTVLGWVNRMGGALLGMLIGMLFASVLLQVISHVPGGQQVKAEYQRSSIGQVIYFSAPTVYQAVRDLAGGDGDDVFNRVMQRTRDAADGARQKVGESVMDASEKARQEAKEAGRDAVNR